MNAKETVAVTPRPAAPVGAMASPLSFCRKPISPACPERDSFLGEA